jgi:pimeloyl-ACP methyl ester carboxylesterase
MPVPASHAAIRQVLAAALHHFDPDEETLASHGLVLIGHSMGGMLARLMVSTADQQLWKWAASDPRIDLDRLGSTRSQLDPLLRFRPFPGVDRVVFVATPHRGTVVAGQGLGRWVAGLIRLPLTLLSTLGDAFPARAETTAHATILQNIPNSIDQLDENDPFVKATSELPISDQVAYHSIVARRQANGPLAESDDGLVPYRSAHLDGAESEKIIVSGHSVQETAASIVEIRRILREDISKHRLTAADSSSVRGGSCPVQR